MRAAVRKLYNEAKNNDVFLEQFLAADPEAKRPNIFTDDVTKHFLVCVYEGWLIARGEFNDSDYY